MMRFRSAAFLSAVFAFAASGSVSAADPYDLYSLGAAALWVTPDVDWVTADVVDFITPAPLAAPFDVTDAESRGCVTRTGSQLVACSEGRSDSDRTVILAGDSKTFQWQPAISAIAQTNGWQLTTLAYSACPLTSSGVPLNGASYSGCEEWIPKAVNYILEAHPDLLIVSGGRRTSYELGGDPTVESVDALVDGYADMWQTFVDAGIPVVVVLNNPSPPIGTEMWQCADANPTALSACTFPYPDRDVTSAGTQVLAAAKVPEVAVVDLDRWICPWWEGCPAVVGNVMVYRRQSHLTRTYVLTMTPYIDHVLLEATGGLFGTPAT